ncbi:unnamed protein product [Umbelopsis ramanniana]
MFAFQPNQGMDFENSHAFDSHIMHAGNQQPPSHYPPPFHDMHGGHVTDHGFQPDMFHMSPSLVDQANMRRHSVAVGEILRQQQVDPNSSYMDMTNQDYDRFRPRHMSTTFDMSPFQLMQQHPYQPSPLFNSDDQQALSTPPHTATTPIQRRQSKSATTITKSKARTNQRNRAMSLRLDTSGSPSAQAVQQSSPLTPAFFSPAFLEALNADTQSSADEADVYPFPAHDSEYVDPSKTMNNARTNPDDSTNHFYSSASPTDSSDIKPSPSSSYMMEQKPFLTQQHTTPTIIEENEELFKNLADYGSHMQLPTQPPVNGLGIRRQSDHFPIQDAKILYTSPSGGVTDMRSAIGHFLSSPSSLAAGEYTVMLLTSKVAQKSYGTEKRFLCPPPTTIILGPHWWTPGSDSKGNTSSNTLHPPKLAIHMSGDATAMSTAQPIQLNTFEWSTAAGDRIDGSSNERFTQNGSKSNTASSTVVTSTNEPILSGRCVSKNLYINDADEKRKRVEVMVKIQLANGFNLGTFASKGIKVISKPSKKRQNAKNMDLCIHHGSTISLFNRIRSQTVSTKYLGVSTSNNSAIRYGGNVPLDWPAPGFSEENLNLNNSTCFSVRTTSWDPFVIWIVDTSGRQQTDPDTFNSQNPGSSAPRRPTPPIIALQDKPDEPIAIHYNQPVVLQCLHTGLVSPVMIIRKVDKGSSVLGGIRTERGPQMGDEFKAGGEYGDEGLGDPVSQLHKVAFQIVNDPSTTLGHHSNFGNQPSFNNESDFLPRLTEPATYLNCASDVVGMHQVSEPRKLNPEMKAELTHRANASRVEAEQFAAANGEWDWASINEPFYNPEMMNPADSAIVAHEGGRVVRKRRVSCDMSSGDMPMYRPNDRPMFTGPGTPQGSTSSPSPVSVNAANNAASSRRRVNSLNDVTLSNESHPRSLKKEVNQGRRSSVAQQGAGANDKAFWTEDVSDAAIWTIVGTDSVMYSFWSASEQVGNLYSGLNNNSAPVTPIPHISHYITDATSDASAVQSSTSSPSPMVMSEETPPHMMNSSPSPAGPTNGKHTLTIYGQSFSPELTVWFGNVPSPRTECRSAEVMKCELPDAGMWFNENGGSFAVQQDTLKVPLLLVRRDGIVYRTRHWFDLTSFTVKLQSMHQGSNAGEQSRSSLKV